MGCTLALASPVRHLMLLDFTPELTQLVQPGQIAYSEGEVSIISVPDQDIDSWVRRVHEKLGGCGGFIDVTDEVVNGIGPFRMVWEELLRRKHPIKRIFHRVRGEDLVAELVALGDKNYFWSFLQDLSAFDDRSATTSNGTKASQFLQDQADALGKNTVGFSTRKVVTPSYQKQPSVVATIVGSDPALPHVVIGAHMDTLSNNKPGSDDDGSGSAVVMEALRAITSSKAYFENTIDFAWYAAEERGLVGSKYVVKDFQNKGIEVAGVLQFDMVGYDSSSDTKDIYLITDYTDDSLNETLRNVIETYTEATIGTTRCGYACSDHASWTRAGFPAVFPFEASFNNMNPRIHTSNDTMKYLSSQHSYRFVQVALAFIGELANINGFKY